jgi:hypothetical protein
MNKKHIPKIPDLILGSLPIDIINFTLGFELEPGDVVLTRGAQRHAATRHPFDYPICLPHISAVVANPLYVGDDLRNHGKIELISRIAAVGSHILVAVNVRMDEDGRYHVESFYPVSEKKIQGRKDKGHLKIARTK